MSSAIAGLRMATVRPELATARQGIRRRLALPDRHRRRGRASDPLDEDIVRSYWVGGPSLNKVDPAVLLTQLRTAFKGQVTGLLDAVPATTEVLAHHSFHVFVVYPWIRFLDRIRRPRCRSCRTAASAGERWNRSRVSTW